MAGTKNLKGRNEAGTMDTRQKFVWGWLRLVLGVGQMTLAVATAGLLFLVGLHAATWIFLADTTILTITSRLLYHGRKAPNQTK
jgi:hypothetical protein